MALLKDLVKELKKDPKFKGMSDDQIKEFIIRKKDPERAKKLYGSSDVERGKAGGDVPEQEQEVDKKRAFSLSSIAEGPKRALGQARDVAGGFLTRTATPAVGAALDLPLKLIPGQQKGEGFGKRAAAMAQKGQEAFLTKTTGFDPGSRAAKAGGIAGELFTGIAATGLLPGAAQAARVIPGGAKALQAAQGAKLGRGALQAGKGVKEFGAFKLAQGEDIGKKDIATGAAFGLLFPFAGNLLGKARAGVKRGISGDIAKEGAPSFWENIGESASRAYNTVLKVTPKLAERGILPNKFLLKKGVQVGSGAELNVLSKEAKPKIGQYIDDIVKKADKVAKSPPVSVDKIDDYLKNYVDDLKGVIEPSAAAVKSAENIRNKFIKRFGSKKNIYAGETNALKREVYDNITSLSPNSFKKDISDEAMNKILNLRKYAQGLDDLVVKGVQKEAGNIYSRQLLDANEAFSSWAWTDLLSKGDVAKDVSRQLVKEQGYTFADIARVLTRQFTKPERQIKYAQGVRKFGEKATGQFDRTRQFASAGASRLTP